MLDPGGSSLFFAKHSWEFPIRESSEIRRKIIASIDLVLL
jgi:hypothetical protein